MISLLFPGLHVVAVSARKKSDRFSHLQIATKRVCKLDLALGFALHLEERRASDDHSNAARTGDSDIEAVKAIPRFCGEAL